MPVIRTLYAVPDDVLITGYRYFNRGVCTRPNFRSILVSSAFVRMSFCKTNTHSNKCSIYKNSFAQMQKLQKSNIQTKYNSTIRTL